MVKKVSAVLLFLILAWGSAVWAANAVTTRTSSESGGVVTHRIPNLKEGCFLYLKYDEGVEVGTSVSVAITVIVPALSATDEYQPIFLSGDAITLNPQTYTTSTTGNYRIPIGMYQGESIIKVTVTFTGGANLTLVVDLADS